MLLGLVERYYANPCGRRNTVHADLICGGFLIFSTCMRPQFNGTIHVALFRGRQHFVLTGSSRTEEALGLVAPTELQKKASAPNFNPQLPPASCLRYFSHRFAGVLLGFSARRLLCVSSCCCGSSGAPNFHAGPWLRRAEGQEENGLPNFTECAGLQTHRRGTRRDRHLGARRCLGDSIQASDSATVRPVRQSATVGLPDPWLSIARRQPLLHSFARNPVPRPHSEAASSLANSKPQPWKARA